MIRKLIAFLAIPAATYLALTSAMAEPALRTQIVVAGPLVTLGDLFEDAGPAASQAVFRSPDNGTEGSVGALRVQAAARQHGLEWHNAAGIEQVAVKRSSRHITLKQIEDAIATAAATKLGRSPLRSKSGSRPEAKTFISIRASRMRWKSCASTCSRAVASAPRSAWPAVRMLKT